MELMINHTKDTMNKLRTFILLGICATVPFGATAMKRKRDGNEEMTATLINGIKNGNVSMAKEALRHGANPNGLWYQQHTPLQLVLQSLHRPLGTDNLSQTAPSRLMAERERKAAVLVKLLCMHHADTNLTTPVSPSSPLYTATLLGQSDIVDTLLTHGSDMNTGTAWPFAYDVDTVDQYIKHGIGKTIDQTTEYNENVLHTLALDDETEDIDKIHIIKKICAEAVKHGKLISLLEQKNKDDHAPTDVATEQEIKELLDPELYYPQIFKSMQSSLKNKYKQNKLHSKNIYHALMNRELTGKSPW